MSRIGFKYSDPLIVALEIDDVAPFLDLSDPRRAYHLRADAVLQQTLEALQETDGDAYAAAALLGVSPSTVYRRLRRTGIPAATRNGANPVAFRGMPQGATRRDTDSVSERQVSA